jgi:hypothetical protein
MATALATLLPLIADVPDAAAQETHRVPGSHAWETARRAGFEFHPELSDEGYILTGARDGAATALKACPSSHEPCVEVARITDGSIELQPARCDDCERAHVFELYAGRLLADGWRIVAVEVRGPGWSWAREPRYGTGDPSFALRVDVPRDAAARVSVAALTLEGPPGAEWRAAFARPGEAR